MRLISILILCLLSFQIYSQEAQLAFQYFRNGEFEKSASIYKVLHEKHSYNTNYINYLIDCYQQLKKYQEIETLIDVQIKSHPNQEYLYIELGYNYQLQHIEEQAIPYYQKAINLMDKSPNLGYIIGKTFQDNHLLDYALLAYKKAMKLNPSANYNFQIAFIYGEKAEIENMFSTYLDMVSISENYMTTAKNYIGKFISDDSENSHNVSLKRLLIKRLQNNPQNSWNNLLSWLYIQQKEYNKAFIQEKALFKRNLTDLKKIIELGKIAFDDTKFETSKNCFNYVLNNSKTIDDKLISNLYLLEIDIKNNGSIEAIESKFEQLYINFGKTSESIPIQIIHAEFIAFRKNEPENGIKLLKEALKLSTNRFEKGQIKTKLADILVYTNKFNSALIYYTQVQNDLKNHPIGQTARFKIAQTSYFKGDFKWAQSQLKILKNSTSQLIANDALDLNLLITDNAVKDSLKIALKKYAIADLLSFQNKNKKAVDTLQVILENYKGHPIEDETLFKQAQLFEKLTNFNNAEQNYLKIIELSKNDILVDDAHYFLAELYLNKLIDTEKAKLYYQKIIFDYPSSIYLVDARKKFRSLRGDEIN